MRHVLMWMIRGYQLALSPFFGGHCRFHPSCSCYAHAAIEQHGAWRGLCLSVYRVARCHPLARGGYDPVPEKRSPHA